MNVSIENQRWYGDIPEGWQEQRIKTIFALKDKRSYKPLEEVNLISVYSKYGVMQHSDIEHTTGNKARNADGYKIVNKGDVIVNILLCWMGAIGRSEYDGVTSPAYDVYEARGDINTKYYHYLFRLPSFSGECYKAGKGIMSMRWRTYSPQFCNIIVPIPPRDEQDQIVRFLDWKVSEINKLINIRRKEIKNLEELKLAVISDTVTHGLDKTVPMKDSGVGWIGEVPEAWEVVSVKRCFIIENGSDPVTKEGNTPVYGSGASSFKMCLESKKGPTVLLGRKGTVNIPQYIEGSYWNVDTAFNTIPKGNYDLKLFYYAACCFDYDSYATKTALPSMTQSAYYNFKLPLPPHKEQEQLVRYLDGECSRIDRLTNLKKQQIEELSELRSSLISDTVIGKIDVRGIEIPEYEMAVEEMDADMESEEDEIEEQED